MKSKDQTQSLKKPQNKKKNQKPSDEEESKSFELLLRSLPGLDRVMLAYTHVHTGVEPTARKKRSMGLCPT